MKVSGCRAALRLRADLIESRNLAMRTARAGRADGAPVELVQELVRAARGCQHEALHFAKSVRP